MERRYIFFSFNANFLKTLFIFYTWWSKHIFFLLPKKPCIVNVLSVASPALLPVAEPHILLLLIQLV